MGQVQTNFRVLSGCRDFLLFFFLKCLLAYFKRFLKCHYDPHDDLEYVKTDLVPIEVYVIP
jgi:hypothetical protein